MKHKVQISKRNYTRLKEGTKTFLIAFTGSNIDFQRYDELVLKEVVAGTDGQPKETNNPPLEYYIGDIEDSGHSDRVVLSLLDEVE